MRRWLSKCSAQTRAQRQAILRHGMVAMCLQAATSAQRMPWREPFLTAGFRTPQRSIQAPHCLSSRFACLHTHTLFFIVPSLSPSHAHTHTSVSITHSHLPFPRTAACAQPHAVLENATGRILSEIRSAGLTVTAVKVRISCVCVWGVTVVCGCVCVCG